MLEYDKKLDFIMFRNFYNNKFKFILLCFNYSTSYSDFKKLNIAK